MTPLAWVLLALAAVAAVTDWWAVGGERTRVEYAAKPAALALIIGVALALTPADGLVRILVALGLAWGLVGDVLLMIGRFIPGMVAFLLGHLLYIAAFWPLPHPPAGLALGVAIVAAGVAGAGWRVVRGAAAKSRGVAVAVGLYLLALAVVVVLAVGSPSLVLGVGALLFATSDTLNGWRRFVSDPVGGRPLIHATYHVGQALIALSLLTISWP